MSASFFRKSALEKLSTPEKLDQLIKVTGPKAWIALLTIALALGVGITWSVFGRVKTKLDVVGVVLGGDVHEVVSTAQGQLVELKVAIGDKVKKGDIIATIQQPELSQQIEDAKAVLADRKFEMGKLLSYGNQGNHLQGEYISQTRVSIQGEIESEKKKLAFLNNQLESENGLLAKGLIVKSQVANTKQQIESSKNTIERLKGQMVETSSQQHTLGYDLQQKVTLQNQRIAEAERTLQFLTEKYNTQKNIRSPYEGEVVEVLTDRGVVVGLGSPLFKVKNEGSANTKLAGLKGVLYIPSKDGKKIKKGMEALVAPSTVQPQEYGFIKSKVTYVSDFPITEKGMLTSVKNDQLAKGLLASGPLFEVHVDFEKDPASYSGFKWTSAKGPDVTIKEGTSCMGKVTIQEERPATIVVPAFKKFFDLY
ncbi:NHLP bacteriocin system secretion protein [Chryseobacterium shandongense]|uniref:NHLP bacteriocin system secretion protein n=1 Tax=Chryseobacterium shandongense TaxID=1493872 RepID=A0AAD0YDK8_9FLAO|nr:NHLP bacteriocin system secretion protein [Chryseobacterium shandongense]AZA86484.1 NHLP bacteriocin system secretion protein [Chryseobacterium shandongense]AZA94892.1 NHLP bacteriocin system secretion protein [Chryseobacterium shandongense]